MNSVPFLRFGAPAPVSPVILSVPHAGRDYPAALLTALKAPPAALAILEDRHVDAVALGARTVQTMIVQQVGRAWIDLNRGEDERDPQVDTSAPPVAKGPASAKLRSGLGLVPRRAGPMGDLWRCRFDGAAIDRRIAEDHRPYHAALATALAAARARFGIAVLLDIHSMPPLGPPGSARIVLGDRFGTTTAPRFVARAAAACDGTATAFNAPYAGGHILARHAAPAAGIHAIQLEIDRSLYLDGRLDRPGAGLAATVALVRRMIAGLEEEALADAMPAALAAE